MFDEEFIENYNENSGNGNNQDFDVKYPKKHWIKSVKKALNHELKLKKVHLIVKFT